MKKYELMQMAGFDTKQVRTLLSHEYQNMLQDMCNRWGLAEQSATVADSAIDRVLSIWDRIETKADMKWMCIHTLRLLILDGAGLQTAPSGNGNSLLTAYRQVEIEWTQEAQSTLNVALSALSRREFEYIIARYYYFEPVYDAKIEKKFAMLLQGKKQANFVTNLRQLPALAYGTNEIITYLSHIDSWWGNQIGSKRPVIKHPDSEQWLFVQHHYNQKRAAVVPVMILTLVLLLILGLNYLGVIALW